MKTTKHIIVIALAALLMTGALYSQPLHSSYMSVAAMGMGGSFTAYPRDATMTIVNPALLNRAKFHLTLLSLPFGLDDDINDIVSFIENNSDGLSNVENLSDQAKDDLIKDAEPIDDTWININVSPFF
ncbi:MAG: hypothetical protein P9X24_19300 [Candidatus Hatepunaea meridiana]|nr:hypothetical protein [Candidatus Hatepunaea meridiana]